MLTLTRSQWKEYKDAGQFPPDDAIEDTVQDLFESLEFTTAALRAILASKPVRYADEVIVHNDKILS